ncbi:MAG: type II toxin-antitoxin system prevent-host-death family antitoxin [Elusimicrobiota bacterium]|nr:type II toxin-antitoxin system prevent-host-death family antitoxin [Elusimicrobiota bacterium]
MTTIGLFEAKQHLSALVERARKGETIGITKRGVVVARLITAESAERRKEIYEAIRANRRGVRLGALSLRNLINEGRS